VRCLLTKIDPWVKDAGCGVESALDFKERHGQAEPIMVATERVALVAAQPLFFCACQGKSRFPLVITAVV